MVTLFAPDRHKCIEFVLRIAYFNFPTLEPGAADVKWRIVRRHAGWGICPSEQTLSSPFLVAGGTRKTRSERAVPGLQFYNFAEIRLRAAVGAGAIGLGTLLLVTLSKL